MRRIVAPNEGGIHAGIYSVEILRHPRSVSAHRNMIQIKPPLVAVKVGCVGRLAEWLEKGHGSIFCDFQTPSFFQTRNQSHS